MMFIELTDVNGSRFMLVIALIIAVEKCSNGRAKIVYQDRENITTVFVEENYSTIRSMLAENEMLIR